MNGREVRESFATATYFLLTSKLNEAKPYIT